MGEILRLIIVIVIWRYVLSGIKKKKKQGRRSAQTGRQRSAKAQDIAATHTSAAESDAVFAQQACDAKPIHLHEVTQEQLSGAQEGEDPCHAGGRMETAARELNAALDTLEALAGRETEPEGLQQISPQEESAWPAQDLLRGVIMSEILTRPCERRNSRRAY